MSSKFSTYLRSYKEGRRTDPLAVRQEVNELMQQYDLAELTKKKELLSKIGVPDEDGFYTAISTNTKAAFRDVGVSSTTTERPAKQIKIMPDFYHNSPYMAKKEKKKEVEDVRKRFAEDRRKIKELSDLLF